MPETEQPHTSRLILIQLMCVSFAVSWLMALQLFDARAVLQLDVWFQSDPDLFMVDHVDIAKFALRHPNVGLFIGLPLSLAQWLLMRLGVAAASAIELRYWLLLLIAPIAASLRTLSAFRAVHALTGKLHLTAMLCLLDIAAFQSVALGSIPETYPLTAACIAGMYWAMEADSRRDGRIRFVAWIALGTVAVAITLTNVVPFVVLLWVALRWRRQRWPRIVATTGSAALLVLALNVALLLARIGIAGGDLRSGIDGGNTGRATHWPTGQIAAEVTWSMAHTFVAPRPVLVPGNEPQSSNPDYDFQILYPPTFDHGFASWWRALITLSMLGLGAAGYLRQRETRELLLPAAAIIGWTFLLHLFFGHYYFLYGLHWQFSMVWVLAGIAFLPIRIRRVATGVLAVFLVITAVNSWMLARELLAQLHTS